MTIYSTSQAGNIVMLDSSAESFYNILVLG